MYLTITCSLWELSFCSSISYITSAVNILPSSLLPVLTHFSQLMCFIIFTLNEVCSFLIILTSYVFIDVTIIKMPSATGLWKAFSTCASHLTTITIFHGTVLFLYGVPNYKSSWLLVKVATVFAVCDSYTFPNPLIYSLRNKDVKETARSLITMKLLSPSI